MEMERKAGVQTWEKKNGKGSRVNAIRRKKVKPGVQKRGRAGAIEEK